MSTYEVVTQEQFKAALDAGERFVFGFPARVELEDGYAAPNLVRVMKGDPDPWFTVRTLGPLIDLQTSDDRGIYADGETAVPADVRATLMKAWDMAPEDRHSEEADKIRLEAGRTALRIGDSMIRARVLDAIDGWSALVDSGTLIDEDDEHGTLVKPAEELELECHILVVKCPSTDRAYALRVPDGLTTAKDARLWTLPLFDGEVPEVET